MIGTPAMPAELGVQVRSAHTAGLGFVRKVWGALSPSFKLLVLLSITAAYLLPTVRILYRVGDQGTILHGAQRVSEGAIPGRDFLEVMGPGSFYWLGIFFKLFGPGWLVTVLVLLFTGVTTAGLLYAIARQSCSEGTAVLLWLFVLVTGMPVWPAANHHWDSNLFAIIALWCYLRLERTRHWRWAIAAGAMSGITSCFMQQKGLLLLLALIASGALRRIFFRTSIEERTKWAPMYLLTAGYIAVGAGVVSAYWKAGALGDLYYANVTWPLSNYHDVNVIPYGQFLVSVAMAPAIRVIGPHWAATALFLAGLSLIPLLVVATLPLLASASALPCLLDAEKRSRWLGGPLLTLTLAGGALWISEMHRRDVFHFIFSAPVLSIVLFASASLTLNTPWRKAISGTLAAGLIVFGVLNVVAHRQGGHTVETRRGTIPSVSNDDALRFLCSSVQRREFVFVYPYHPIYYYLADVRNPTRFSILLYGYNTPEHFDEVIRNLEEKRVRYVLWDTEMYGDNLRLWFPAYRHPTEDKLKLEHYLQARYELVALKSGFRIMRRRAEDVARNSPGRGIFSGLTCRVQPAKYLTPKYTNGYF